MLIPPGIPVVSPIGLAPVMTESLCFGSALPLLDLDHLPAAVLAAARADVMRLLHLATAAARHELRGGDEVMAATVALVSPANSLLWKCAHPDSS
jgi:hypothetical protein